MQVGVSCALWFHGLVFVSGGHFASYRKLIASFPDKKDDPGTTTHRMKLDIVRYCLNFGKCKNMTVAELGCWAGHTTALLSRLFKRVFVLDNSKENLARARGFNSDRSNIIYLRHDLYDGAQRYGWSSMVEANNIDVVLIDAAHTYAEVYSDLDAAVNLPSIKVIMLDDFGLMEGVRKPVLSYSSRRYLSCFGIGKPWDELSEDLNLTHVNEPTDLSWRREGAICTVTQKGTRPDWHLPLNGKIFVCSLLTGLDGLLMPMPTFMFHIWGETLLFRWPMPSNSSIEVGFKADPVFYDLVLLQPVKDLVSRIQLTPNFRSAVLFSTTEPFEPEYSCRDWADVYRLVVSTAKDTRDFKEALVR